MSNTLRRAWQLLVAACCIAPAIPHAQPSPTAIVDRLRSTTGRAIDFHAALFPDTVFVGEQATYQVAVLLDAEARARLRRNPEFLPPELRGLLAFELGTPRRVPSRSYPGGEYEAHVFQRALFAVAPGRITVPSPQLTYSLPQSSSYFSREERFLVRAESAQLVVRALPDSGRPDDFLGAVGNYRATARLDGRTARVGDPLVLTVRIEGIGNVKLLPRPLVEVSWASVVSGSERVQLDTSGALVRGSREFDYILTPAQSGPVVLPVVSYSYFDPVKERYDVARTVPADLVVADGSLAGAAPPEETQALPLRTWRNTEPLRIESVPPTLAGLAVLLVVAAPLMAFASGIQARLRARPPRTTSEFAVSAVPPIVRDDPTTPGGAARKLRRDVLAQLARRLAVIPTDLVTSADVYRVARRRGVSREGTRELLALLDRLALQGFGGGDEAADASLDASAQSVLARIDAEAVRHGRTRLWSRRRTGVTAMVLLAGALARPTRGVAQGPASVPVQRAAPGANTTESNRVDVAAIVREATAAYDARRYARATERFADAVRARPTDADLLMNWGTAAWAASDTVASVVAWQRAARLEPLAADAQQRLTLLPAGARDGIADVPMVPVFPLAVLGLLTWVAGALWLAIAWRTRDEINPPSWRIAAVLMVVGAAAGTTAAWGHNRLDAESLSIVRRPEAMRVAPGLDANTSGGTATGDVVRRLAVQEGWTRVEHADGRIGWLPSGRLVALMAPLLDDDSTR